MTVKCRYFHPKDGKEFLEDACSCKDLVLMIGDGIQKYTRCRMFLDHYAKAACKFYEEGKQYRVRIVLVKNSSDSNLDYVVDSMKFYSKDDANNYKNKLIDRIEIVEVE